VHPDGDGTDLDVWIDRALIRYGFAWRIPAAGEVRVGVGSYEPRHHVKEPAREIAGRLDLPPVRYQGNWFPHRLRPAIEDGVFFVGDSAGHCFPLSGEGIRTAFYFGIACGRELRAVLAGAKPRGAALHDYAAFSDRHRPAFERAYRLQRLIPALPPRALTALLGLMGREHLCRRAFSWYLDQAHPRFASSGCPGAGPDAGSAS
jgi:flavin-dependent dehydrogenase